MKHSTVTGFALIWVILSMTVYGLHPILSHYLVEDIDPILLAGVSLFIASFPLMFQVSYSKNLHYFYKGNFLQPLLFVVLYSGIADLIFFVGTKFTSGVNTALLLQIEPIYAIVLAGIFLGEVIKVRYIFAILTVVLGALVVVYKGAAPLNLGDILIMLSPLFYQFSHLYSKKIMHKIPDTNIIPAVRLFYGGMLLTIFAVIVNPSVIYQLFSPAIALTIFLFGLYRSLDYYLWYQVLKRLPLSVASAFLPLSVFVSFLGAMIFLREPVFLAQYIGLTLIVGGLFWLSFMHMQKKETPKPNLDFVDEERPI